MRRIRASDARRHGVAGCGGPTDSWSPKRPWRRPHAAEEFEDSGGDPGELTASRLAAIGEEVQHETAHLSMHLDACDEDRSGGAVRRRPRRPLAAPRERGGRARRLHVFAKRLLGLFRFADRSLPAQISG